MCPGPRNAMACNKHELHQQQPSASLLELAAEDDLAGFRRAVQEDKLSFVAASSWYGPSSPKKQQGACRRLALQLRTPAMVAALYGSTQVLSYVLSMAPSEAARASASDGATPLQLAAAGRAPSAPAATRLLLAAGASPDADTILLLPPEAPTKESTKKKDYSTAHGHGGAPAPAPEDINAGVFGTDEFRMYSFKVNPCSRAYTHDWTECPFAHPGENARRRDPRRYAYSCVPCPEFRSAASCRKGDACEYAHGVFESWLHPAQYRTRLCKDEVGCPRRICFFAHGKRQLRQVNPSAASMASSSSNSSGSSPSRPVLKASLSSRELEFDVSGKHRLLSAQSDYSDLIGAYVQALSLQQQQQQQAGGDIDMLVQRLNSNSKPPLGSSSRAAAFANRSQSFVHRAPAPAPAARSFAPPAAASVLAGWGSPDGKLDWGVHGAELRKSTSFGIGSSRPQATASWLNDSSNDILAARWSDLEQMVA
ncbi:zinc finger CCCH domain-containing protein 33 [Brachypodium distachyon]|uniref:zinc finger CCCH domain-containing protein 33 n=1 Tax=Brachypodium distachyon TaxID=15368 RepID=UPI000234F22B|nr:zinc finger CCCH domain-containing protein 33 [Brachypodium distachyon]|eukprot:XP_003575849.1 zinc finger CCCH domain-containing protein 33 [Brachypodium distachyon]